MWWRLEAVGCAVVGIVVGVGVVAAVVARGFEH